MAEVHYMSQEGLDKLKKDLAEALAQRPVISAAIAEAREKGDLSENAEYESAREAQGLLELKIAKLQNTIANAKVIDESQLNTDKVRMLTTVKVKNLSADAEMVFTIVGENEADFS
ncbi:MAG: transcription elongation factor GreA, partial [Clostridia bacterium]|nr:transcription elongation factor GreA [Clostridia bacterium]